MQRSNYIQKKK